MIFELGLRWSLVTTSEIWGDLTMTSIKEVLPKQAFEALQANSQAKFIDVRTPAEFAEVHAKNAVLYPLDDLDPVQIKEDLHLSAQDEIYIICRSGARSYQAAMIFADAGFQNPINVKGGTILWVKENLPHEV
jgi:rhodanese-related sulfurtransferase